MFVGGNGRASAGGPRPGRNEGAGLVFLSGMVLNAGATAWNALEGKETGRMGEVAHLDVKVVEADERLALKLEAASCATSSESELEVVCSRKQGF